jgi:hypothetical protein
MKCLSHASSLVVAFIALEDHVSVTNAMMATTRERKRGGLIDIRSEKPKIVFFCQLSVESEHSSTTVGEIKNNLFQGNVVNSGQGGAIYLTESSVYKEKTKKDSSSFEGEDWS